MPANRIVLVVECNRSADKTPNLRLVLSKPTDLQRQLKQRQLLFFTKLSLLSYFFYSPAMAVRVLFMTHLTVIYYST